MPKKFTIKKKEITKAKASDNKDYKITIPEDTTEEKEKWNDGDKVTITGKVKITELDDKGKDTTTTKDNANATLVYKEGTLFNYFKVEEVDGKNFADKEQKEVSAGGFGSYRLTFWFMIVAFVLVLVGFVWWWISSSRKEDKEEEGL